MQLNKKAYDEYYKEYEWHKSESKACGYEYQSWREYLSDCIEGAKATARGEY